MFGMKWRDEQIAGLWTATKQSLHRTRELEAELAGLRRDLDLLLERTGYKPVHCEQNYWYLESMPDGAP